MNASNAMIIAILALLVGAVAYWYQAEGGDLFDQVRQSDNKPFFLNQFD